MRVTYHCVLTLREFPGNVLSSPLDEVDGVWRFKEMSSIANARLRAEFEKFLYAPIGQSNEGMPLSVLSALARRDVDPWEEAAKLTQLPEEKAVSQLVSLLGASPHAPLAGPDSATIAMRLIALLPRHRENVAPTLRLNPFAHAAPAGAQAAPDKNSALFSNLLYALTYMILLLFSAWLISSLQPPAALQAPSTAPTSAISQQPVSNENSR